MCDAILCQRPRQVRLVGLELLIAAVAAMLTLGAMTAPGAQGEGRPPRAEMTVLRDLEYVPGGHERQRLDLYLSKQEGREAQSRVTSFVHQTLTALPVVQAFATENHNRRQFKHLAGDAVNASQRGALVNKAYGVVSGLTTTIGADQQPIA